MRAIVSVACAVVILATGCNAANDDAANPPLGTLAVADTPCDGYKNDLRLLMAKAAASNDEAAAAGEDLDGGAMTAPDAAEEYSRSAEELDELREDIVALGDPPDATLARPAALIVDALGMLADAHRTTASGILDEDEDRIAAGRDQVREGSILFNEASLMLPGTCS